MPRFQVLVHAPLYAALRRLPAAVRARFRRRLERLSTGDWAGGTRVKKLRACAKPVYEARQDGGDRILFTLAHTAARDATGALPAHLQVWDLVHHDDVTRRAARINPSAEAEFLGYDVVDEAEIDRPPAHPAAAFADIPAELDAEAGLVEFVAAGDALDLHPREEIEGGVRWYVLPDALVVDEPRWQELMDRGLDELELKLTAEQYAVVRAPGPTLLSGSAGSGKTTIAVHRLAAATAGPGGARALYVTYSAWLLDHARRLFGDLVACRGDAVRIAPEFLAVHDLYRAILARAGGAAPQRVVDYPEFARWYADTFRRDDAALAWEEIRSIVKGASLDPARPLLSRDEYEALGRKRAPLFVGERPRLYQVALRWQQTLDTRGLGDEIDLCRHALARVPPGGLYDHVFCDEAQDLAEIQVELLLRLLRGASLANLFLAGDPQQVINPSGFRWAEVRSRIRDRCLPRGRPVPDLHVLRRNFRSVGGIVELANEVLAFKRDRVGRSDGDQPEEAVAAGAAPILVVGEEVELAGAIRGFGPRCAVVAGTPELRTRLQASLDTTRVFTVPEAKGLEFDAAVLWGLVAGDPGPWRRLLDPSVELREDPACRRALHHLYVAVTRARRHLAVYEPAGAPPLWTSGRFASRLDPDAPAALERLFVRSAPPEDWMREAEYFFERGRHRQAAECFRRAGDTRREAESLALHHEAAGEHALAAERWVALGDAARAARCFEAAGDHDRAAREWAQAGDAVAAARCGARAAEAARRWSDAARAWEALEAWADAARCWGQAGLKAQSTRCWAREAEAAGRHQAAAEWWGELEEWDRAAAAWRAAGRESQALAAEARAHEAGQRWAEAARAWDAAGDAARARRCRAEAAERAGRWEEAARMREELGDFPAAIRAWQSAGRPEEGRRIGARRDLREGRFARAAETLEDLGDFGGAAEAWARAADQRQQAPVGRPLPLPAAARGRWSPEGKPAHLAVAELRRAGAAAPPDCRVRALVCAARAAEDGGRFAEAAAAWRRLRDQEQALRCRVAHLLASGSAAGAAALLESRRRYPAAAAYWRQAGDARAAARCEALDHERRRRFEDAATAWAALGDREAEARCRALVHLRREEYDEAVRCYEAAGNPQLASEVRQIAARKRAAAAAAGHAAAGPAPVGPILAQRLPGRGSIRTRRSSPRFLVPVTAGAEDRPGARAPGRVPSPSAPGRAPSSVAAGGPELGADPEAAVLEAVRRLPWMTCEGIAGEAGLPTALVKPILAELTARGVLRKTGRTRGTRYAAR